MIQFEKTAVFNLCGAIEGMRNSWGSHDKSDSGWIVRDGECVFEIGDKDLALAMRLSKAGSDHGKYLRQILLSVDITAPEYLWRELDTYKIGTVANSTSQMHKLGSRLLTTDDFAFDDPNDVDNIVTVHMVNRLVKNWWDAGRKKPSPEWRKLIQNMPQSFLYTRHWTANYQVLKHIHHARKSHRLQEWREMCTWIESLPYSELITLQDGESHGTY